MCISYARLYHRVWKASELHNSTKIKVYKACIIPVLLYGAATWTLRTDQLRKLESFHHRSLRKILNIPWQRFVPTTQVLDQAKMDSIESMVKKLRVKWLGHVRRMPDDRLPKLLMCCELSEGKRRRGRPSTRWKDIIRKDFKHLDINESDWWDLSNTENKSKWRTHINKNVAEWEFKRKADTIVKRAERKRRQREVEESRQGQGEHKCPMCIRRYVQKSSLFRHIATTHPGYKPPLQCKICKRTFSNRSGMSRHKCRNNLHQ